MKTQIWDMRQYSHHSEDYPYLDEIKHVYEQGGLIALPTETVYGLGANAKDQEAVTKIYEAKGRPSDNPLIVHIYDQQQLTPFIETITDKVQILMNYFWPGPISFILPLKRGYLCEKVTGGLDSIAVRMPSHPIGRAILKYVDLPIAAPSANTSGKPSPTTFDHVYHDLNGKIDGIINGDQSEEGLESTVLDCTTYPFKIARPGAITQSMINAILPDAVVDSNYNDMVRPIAPGMKYKHYAPDIPVTIVKMKGKHIPEIMDKEHAAFIFPEVYRQQIPSESLFIPLCKDDQDIKTANHNLYKILHDLDNMDHVHKAYIYGFDINDGTQAIMNRMLKAAANRMIGE